MLQNAAAFLRRVVERPSSEGPSRKELWLWGHRGRALPEHRLSEQASSGGGSPLPRPGLAAALAQAKAIKGKQIKIRDQRDLLSYLQSDLDDGTGPRPYNVEEGSSLDEEALAASYRQSSRTRAFVRETVKKSRAKQPKSAVLAKLDAQLADGEDRAKYLSRCLDAFLMAVQGALAGYTAAIASIEYALDDNEDLVEHYGQVSNLFRRWAFVLSTMALVGALNKFHVAHQDRGNWKNLAPLDRVELRVLVVFYLGAFILSLASANVDVSLSTEFAECSSRDCPEDDDTPRWRQTFTTKPMSFMSLDAWRTAVWIRFALAATGWLLSCRRHDRRVHHADQAHRQVQQLRKAIDAASISIAESRTGVDTTPAAGPTKNDAARAA